DMSNASRTRVETASIDDLLPGDIRVDSGWLEQFSDQRRTLAALFVMYRDAEAAISRLSEILKAGGKKYFFLTNEKLTGYADQRSQREAFLSEIIAMGKSCAASESDCKAAKEPPEIQWPEELDPTPCGADCTKCEHCDSCKLGYCINCGRTLEDSVLLT